MSIHRCVHDDGNPLLMSELASDTNAAARDVEF